MSAGFRSSGCKWSQHGSFSFGANRFWASVRGSFGGSRGARPVPPEKGVFPLDHNHECDLEKKVYLTCLKTSGHLSEKCRDFSKKYLQCRMEKNLMAKQDMAELGFSMDDAVKEASKAVENEKQISS